MTSAFLVGIAAWLLVGSLPTTFAESPPTVTELQEGCGTGARIRGIPTDGAHVYIVGTNFTTATSVQVLGTPISDHAFWTVQSDTCISAALAALPSHPPASGYITVTNGAGTSATGTGSALTYDAAPTITSLSSNTGPATGGQTVTITGTGFLSVYWLENGPHTCPGTSQGIYYGSLLADNDTITVDSDTKMHVTFSGQNDGITAAPGTVHLRVCSLAGFSNATSADKYTFLGPPAVTALSAHAGGVAGGETITVTGTGFNSVAATGGVKMFSAPASYTVNSDTKITLTVPAHAAGTGYVRVTNAYGTSAQDARSSYSWDKAPTVGSLSTHTGSTAGGTVVTVTGTGLGSVTAVKFGTTPGTGLTILSDTSLQITAPAHAAGTIDVQLVNPTGTSALSTKDRFTFS